MGLSLLKPEKLKQGDKVATISLSWGGAGDSEIHWRYQQGKQRLEEVFGLNVVEMPHTLKGTEFVYNNPAKRAEDLMMAFSDKSIKAVFSCIGGDDSIRMLPYIDFDIIKNNPKVFMGYSDTTITHLLCLKAGVTSFYGPAILSDFAENISMYEYTVESIKKALFHSEPIGEIECSNFWTSHRLEWIESNKNTLRNVWKNTGYDLVQGPDPSFSNGGIVQGRLIGGCLEVLEMAKGTSIFPDLESFKDAILFLETSEDKPVPYYIEYWLRTYGIMGILHRLKGIIWGKPYDNLYYDEYKVSIKKVLKEFGLSQLPVLYNANFGHAAPLTVLPYGALAEINCAERRFSILESGVV